MSHDALTMSPEAHGADSATQQTPLAAVQAPALAVPDIDRQSPRHESHQLHRFAFTGSGREYFRIWIVNLCLTMATLGLYSPWAKVRRLQYFAHNTQLDGAAFDFHGDPKVILKGRLVALSLFAAYHYAFDFSRTAGLAIIGFLLMTFPVLIRNALRFRLANTSYRGLRFGFDGSVRGAYGAYFPVMLLFVLPTIMAALFPTQLKLLFGVFAFYLLWPLLHAQIRRYQHNGMRYGTTRASCFISTGDFFAMYFFAVLIGAACVAMIGVLSALGVVLAKWVASSTWSWFIPTLVVAVCGYFAYLLSIPYVQIRVFNAAWSATTFGGISIRSELKVAPFIRLQIANTLLTLATLGLYRPFAVVRTYRYRLEHMTAESDDRFDNLLASQQRSAPASGDSLADFLNFDLSW